MVFTSGLGVVFPGVDVGRGKVVEVFTTGPWVMLPGEGVMRGLVVEEFPAGSRVVLPGVGLVGKGLVVEVKFSGGKVDGPVTSVLFSVV